MTKYLSCCDVGKQFLHIQYTTIDTFYEERVKPGYYIIDDEKDICLERINYCPFCGKEV